MSLTKYAEYSDLEVLDAFVVPQNAGHRRMARLRRRSHRHHFEYDPRPGYIYVRSRAISSRCNDNYDEFPAEEIKKAYRTFIGKPVFVNHHNADHRRARGVIIDAALHEDLNPDNTPDTWAEVLMEVDAVRFPVLAREVKKGNIARTSMGTDVEYSICTACGNKAYTPAEYCQHIPRMKGMKVHRTLASGAKEEVLIAERCYGLGFFENSLLVEDPADPTAFVLGVDEPTISRAAARAVIEEGERIARTAASGDIERIEDLEVGDPVMFRHDEIGARSLVDGTVVANDGSEVTIKGDVSQNRIDNVELARDDWTVRRARRAVEALVSEAGQCVYCNPSLRTTGSEIMCDSHALQAAHGTLDFPSHNFPVGSRHIESAQDYSNTPVFTEEQLRPGVWMHLGDGMFATKCGRCGDIVRGGDYNMQRHLWEAHQVSEPMLPRSQSSRHHAYGETKAPAQVDTMRAASCPVCGDDEAFNGERCNVCGYTQPPSQFQDPDLTKAREMDLRQQQDEQAGLDPTDPGVEEEAVTDDDLQCTNCGEVFSAEGDAEAGTDPAAEAEEKEAEPKHPDATEDGDGPEADEPDDLRDLADTPDEELFDDDEGDEEEPDPEEDPAPQDPAVGEGRITAEPEDDNLDAEVEEGATCPVCGEGTLVPVPPQPVEDGEPKLTEVGEDPTKKKHTMTSRHRAGQMSKETVDMNQPNPAQQRRNRIVAAIREQQGVIERQGQLLANQYREIVGLRDAVATLAVAAGVGNHPKFAGLVRSAGLKVASEESPATSTEEAAKPKATDDVENVGAAPGSANDEVTPEGVTDVNNSDVTANPPVLDNLQDVTAPVAGTDAVVPDAGDAGSASQVTVGTPSNETFDKPGDSGWKSSSRGTETERFVASLRLARMRIAAGIEKGEDLTLAQRIAEGKDTLGEITAQATALASVAARQRQVPSQDPATRHLVPRSANRGDGQRQQPSMQAIAATTEARAGEDEWMVGSIEG